MVRRAAAGYTGATELANRLTRRGGMSFRSAHRMVGGIVRAAVDRGGEPLELAAARSLSGLTGVVSLADLDPTSVARSAAYGGGPGSTESCIDGVEDVWREHRRRKRQQGCRWGRARSELDTTVRALIGSSDDVNVPPRRQQLITGEES
jgi:argininosuccinate lyase